jgi:hypothetical protein
MNRSLVVFLILLASCPAAVLADEGGSNSTPDGSKGQREERRFQLTPFAGYRIGGTFEDENTGEKLELNDAGAYGLMLNWRESFNTEWEIMFSHQGTDIDIDGPSGPTSIDIDVDYLQIGGTYLGRGARTRPYMVATLGAARLDPGAPGLPSDIFFAFTIGGGMKVLATERFGLRLEGRFYGTVIDSNSKIFCGSGSGGAGCLINTSADLLWQFEASAGLIFRF